MRILRIAAAAIVFAASLSGCGSMSDMARQQDDYNRTRCHDTYGLNPGTNEYARCVSMGANAYAQAQKNAAATPNAPTHVVIAAPAANNSCSVDATPKGQCAGCSVSCGAKQASCTVGTEWPDGSGCIKNAVCECH